MSESKEEEESFSIANFFMGVIAYTLDLFGGLKLMEEKNSSNGKRNFEENKFENSFEFHKKKSGVNFINILLAVFVTTNVIFKFFSLLTLCAVIICCSFRAVFFKLFQVAEPLKH